MNKKLKRCTFSVGILCVIVVTYINANIKANNIKSDEEIIINTSYDVVIVDDMEKCLESSQLIVRGIVTEEIGSELVPVISEQEFNQLEEEEKIYYQDIITKYYFEISEVIKGECDKNVIIYNVLGGTNGKYIQTFTGEGIHKLPEIGDEYVLFLNQDKNGGYSTYSMIQGRIEVINSDNNINNDLDVIKTEDPLFSECDEIEDLKKSINSVSDDNE